MLTKVVLIIDKRKELSTKYKKLLESLGMKVFCTSDIPASLDILTTYEPDLIVISDSLDEEVTHVCKQIRILSYNFRPTVVVVSKSAHMPDMISALDSGADDFLSEPIEAEEFKARINAHFRRHFESNLNETTQLFDSKISFQYLRRLMLNPENHFAAMLIDIDNFDFYKEIYGEIAADKMLQTYQAIITSVIDKEDYFGHLGLNDFLVVTKNISQIEKIASFCVYAFDSVVEKFYSQDEKARGFMLVQNSDNAEKFVSFVSTSIGIILNEHREYKDIRQLINALISTHKLAKQSASSKYVLERPKLTSATDVESSQNFNLLIVEEDESLSYLIGTAAQLRGYNCKILNNFETIFAELEAFKPAVVLIDTGVEFRGVELIKKIKEHKKHYTKKIIATATDHDKVKILNSGANVYLPKPYELSTMFHWIERMFSEYNY